MQSQSAVRPPRSITLALVCLFFLTGISGCDREEKGRPDSAPGLIEAFRGGCVSSGKWTDAARSHTQSLQDLFRKLGKDHPCNAFVTRLALIEDYTQSINQLLADESFRSYRVQEENAKELTLAIAQTSDPALQAALQDALIEVQVEIARARAESVISKDVNRQDRLKTYSQNLTRYTQQLLADAGDLTTCLRTSPETAVEIATNLIAMGGSLVSPIYGAGSQVIGTLINLGIEAARQSATEQAIWELYGVQMPTALSCGLEAMTELHCQATETHALLTLSAEEQVSRSGAGPEAGSAREVLELYSRHLPLLIEWLRELKNGIPPSNSSEAGRRIEAYNRIRQIENQDLLTKADLTQLDRSYQLEPDPRERVSLLITFVRNTANAISPTHTNGYNPTFSSISTNAFQFACWLARGYGASDCEKITLQPGTDVESYIRGVLAPHLSLEPIHDHWGQIVSAALQRANADYLETNSLDSRAILQKAKERPPLELSTREILGRIDDFLAAMELHPETPADRLTLLRQTRRMITETTAIIDLPDTEQGPRVAVSPSPAPSPSPVPAPLDPDKEFRERVQQIYTLLRLKDGPQFFFERISRFIEWDLNDRMNRGELAGEIGEILKYLGGDIRSRLLAPGSDNIQEISSDLSKARQITEGNIDIFRDFFKTSLAKSVSKLHAASRPPFEDLEGADRPNGQQLGQLCALLLVSGASDSSWPAEVDWKLCEQASYYYPGNPRTTPSIRLGALREELRASSDQTRKHRMCGYHRYIRETRVREILAEVAAARARRQPFGALRELLDRFLP